MNKKFNCKICNREYDNIIGLSRHIGKCHKDITKEDYYTKYLMTENDNDGVCQNDNCNNRTTFVGFVYREYCSSKCFSSSKKIRDKIKNTNLERYGFTNPAQSQEIKEKVKQTNLKKYGVENTLQSKEIREKGKKTCSERYGFENPNQSEEIKHKIKKTCSERYGVENTLQSKEIREKGKKTCLERYGFENPFQSKEIQDKIRQTNLERYGVENVSQSEEVKKSHFINFYNKLFNSDRLKNLVKPLFTEEEYEGAKGDNKYKFKCVKCNNEFKDHLDNGHIPRCNVCYPSNSSKPEIEIFEFIKSLGINVFQHNRDILNGKELDVYIPSKNTAIELNGIFWHSELHGKNKDYHLDKTLKCEEQGIQLIHIFEDEWYDKKDIVKSMIKNKLGMTDTRIFARKCKIKDVEKDISKPFLYNNHLQGECNGKSLGLFYNDKLVSILTYGKSRFNKNYDFEILRFCNKLNGIVVGGFSRLVKCLLYKLKNESIISYADRRFGKGNVYLKCGFEKVGESKPSYYYVKGWSRFNRMKFQKHKLQDKLEIFDPKLTEWENMQLNEYDRIWDCGNNVFTFKGGNY